MNEDIKPGQMYRHYKNRKVYHVTCLATNPNTGELVVVYHRDYTEQFWRPLTEFKNKFTRYYL